MLGHVGSAVRFGTLLLQHSAPVWELVNPPGEAVEGDPRVWWDALVGPARSSVRGVDLSQEVDSAVGRRSIGDGLSFPALDLYVHGWDLGRVVGVELDIPDDVIAFTHALIDPIPDETVRNPQVFATQRTPPPDSTPTQSFIAWTGRNPHWVPDS